MVWPAAAFLSRDHGSEVFTSPIPRRPGTLVCGPPTGRAINCLRRAPGLGRPTPGLAGVRRLLMARPPDGEVWIWSPTDYDVLQGHSLPWWPAWIATCAGRVSLVYPGRAKPPPPPSGGYLLRVSDVGGCAGPARAWWAQSIPGFCWFVNGLILARLASRTRHPAAREWEQPMTSWRSILPAPITPVPSPWLGPVAGRPWPRRCPGSYARRRSAVARGADAVVP